MAGLHADELSTEFLRQFLTETLYLVPADAAAPASLYVAPAAPATAVEPESPEVVEPPVTNEVEPAAPPVVAPAIPKLPKSAAAPAFTITGENKKGVALLVTLSDEEFKKLPDLEFLQKMLQAIGLSQTDVAYVNNVSGKVAELETLQQQLNVNYLISFASRVTATVPHDKFRLYHPVRVGDVQVVFAQALAVLEDEMAHKRDFWGALQQVFLS